MCAAPLDNLPASLDALAQSALWTPNRALPIYRRGEVPAHLRSASGWRAQRRRLVADATPAAFYRNRFGVWPLYAETQTEPIPYARLPRQWPTEFAARYGLPLDATDRHVAYLDTCEALFQLNRYAKHDRCSLRERATIYALKNALVERLWQEGYCIQAVRAFSPKRDLPCWSCDGTGDHPWYEGDACDRCGGTGVYRTVGGVSYWALRFVVEGVTYLWHQPERLAPWANAVGAPEETPHEVTISQEPVTLPRRQFGEAKALIAWAAGLATVQDALALTARREHEASQARLAQEQARREEQRQAYLRWVEEQKQRPDWGRSHPEYQADADADDILYPWDVPF